jgi:quercetin dioxygenase-like cupin family protein
MTSHIRARFVAPALVCLTLLACGDRETPTSSITPNAPQRTVGSGQTTTQLGRSRVDPFHIQSDFEGHRVELKSHDPSDIIVNSSSLAPGGFTGWHTHSGPVMVVVTSGAFTMYHGDDPACAPTVYSAGAAFIETGGPRDIHIGRNEGSIPVTWVATAIVPVGVAGRVDLPAPGNCPF